MFRYLRDDEAGDPTIVNPARLDKKRSSAVCGQCHSFSAAPDAEAWRQTGSSFRAGDSLHSNLQVFRYAAEPRDPLLLSRLEAEPDALHGRGTPAP